MASKDLKKKKKERKKENPNENKKHHKEIKGVQYRMICSRNL